MGMGWLLAVESACVNTTATASCEITGANSCARLVRAKGYNQTQAVEVQKAVFT